MGIQIRGFTTAQALVPSAMMAAPHLWRVTDDQRAKIDWARSDIMHVIDEYSDLTPLEVLKIVDVATRYQRRIMDGLISPLDRERLAGAATRCEDIMNGFYDHAPHETMQSLMLAATLLVTGTEYDRPDSPEDYYL